ncbi:MAG TPA: quinoprotein dehydrogenase-associated SoxYZ-like carrier [Steroidobacteraceae bacterium]|nr:quinoprotein dehydrogenase-associated SoxYZ-like carrier [Steroidobacteraceae bacterium]
MGVNRRLFLVAASCLTAFSPTAPAQVDEDEAARNARWSVLQGAIFGDRKVEDGTGVIELEAPPRALDAALVPLTVSIVGRQPVKSVYLVIDNNPGPLAGRFTFGPAADPRTLKVRMRVNQYTDIHAVAEGADGRLYSVKKFVKAAGGCSAPVGSGDAKALQGLGQMRLKLLDGYAPGKPSQAQLMIRHPQFNGMQMDQITRNYTMPHFIKTIDVSHAGQAVLRVESDIALSTDPVITFGFVPRAEGPLKVVVRDSGNMNFERSFEVPVSDAVSRSD